MTINDQIGIVDYLQVTVQSCTASCEPIDLPEFIPDPNLSEDENFALSIDQAANEPITIEGLSVSTPAELDETINGIFGTSDADSSDSDMAAENRDTISQFSTIPKEALEDVLGQFVLNFILSFNI